MGQFYSFRLQEFGATGVPIPSARLYTFDPVATTTPKATYSDNDLSVSNGAYVQADAAGVFPQIFAANGEAFYASLRTAAGVEVQQFQFLTALGSDDASSLLRDFTTNGRFQVRGADGIVQIETGDPAGDDVGGDARMGGWEGTQGTTLELDYADVSTTGDFDVAGALTADTLTVGSSSNLPILLSSGNATHAAGIALPTGYAAYRMELSYITLSAVATIEGFFAFDGVPTYKTGADDYAWLINWNGIAGATTAGAAIDISDARMALMNAEAAITGINPGRATIEITSSALLESGIAGTIWLPNDNGSYSPRHGMFSGQTRGKTYGKATHFKLSPSSGTMAYRYALFGIPGLGTT